MNNLWLKLRLDDQEKCAHYTEYWNGTIGIAVIGYERNVEFYRELEKSLIQVREVTSH